MGENDVWIEVSLTPVGLNEFLRIGNVPIAGYDPSIGRQVVQFNLTAYVKHMIAEAKQGT